MIEDLRVGGRTVSFDVAAGIVKQYTTSTDPKNPFAYPYYDGLKTGVATKLADADFLAPLLLNAAPSIAGYASMSGVRTELEAGLSRIPVKAQLASATDAEIELLRELYAPLDADLYGIRGTILSKVLHRKRPAFIPLYDEHVRRCYQDGVDAPLPTEKGRAWSEFMVRLAMKMRDDINASPLLWKRLRARTPRTPLLTVLRCLDIVAWDLGG
jgi:hypothetical protein